MKRRLLCTAALILFATTLQAQETTPPSIVYAEPSTRTPTQRVTVGQRVVFVDRGISWAGKTAYLSPIGLLVVVEATSARPLWCRDVGLWWRRMTFRPIAAADGPVAWAIELRAGQDLVRWHDLTTGAPVAVPGTQPAGTPITPIHAWHGALANNRRPIQALITSQTAWNQLRRRMFEGRPARQVPPFCPIDFDRQVVLVISLGNTTGTGGRLKPGVFVSGLCAGIGLREAVQSETRVLLRLRHHHYQSGGWIMAAWPYGIFVLPRRPGRTYVVQDDVRNRIQSPPVWKTVFRATLKGPDPSVTALLEALDAPHFGSRERAGRALERLGPPVLPALRRFVAATSSLEARRRAGRVVARIQRNAIEGGSVSAGLRATLRYAKTRFRVGEPIELELELRNVGPREVIVPAVGRFRTTEINRVDAVARVREPGFGAPRGPAQATVVIKRPPPRALDERSAPTARPAGDVRLRPGQRTARRFTLRSLAHGRLEPGTYAVHVIYHAASRQLVAGATTDLTSNVFEFEILG